MKTKPIFFLSLIWCGLSVAAEKPVVYNHVTPDGAEFAAQILKLFSPKCAVDLIDMKRLEKKD